ncbi:DUF2207 domain-containing protein [Actinomadura sp. NAK00032]|uniref:DUF2207 domain-containing protein n=1 Tax=Actinomadura sp. NAK00032 TaxID=2742128 RepID=UPI0015913235|nr:DUF2207 domain-containing protein [Actinomadura sp. NAK00032]QKW38762.1 DUF2207 domain-containing protein [Actinomadura sp. NAK00032]
MRGRVRGRVIFAGLLLLILVLVLPAPARAAGERIPTYDVVLRIGADGVLHVRETITYDFDRSEHGIVRHVPFRRGDRVYDVRNVRTSSSTGAPSRVRMTRFLRDVRISVGDRHREVRGRQAYVLEYEVRWAFTPRPGHDELEWDAIGTAWDVPIGNAAVRVEAPVPLRRVGCRAGAPDASTRCLRDRDGPYAVDFVQTGLAPHEGMRIRVRLPKHAITVPAPHRVPPRWAGGWPGTAVLALALGALALIPRLPVPRRRAGVALVAAGLPVVAADAGEEVAARGLWAFSLGDGCLAGLALLIVGAGMLCAHRRTPHSPHRLTPHRLNPRAPR